AGREHGPISRGPGAEGQERQVYRRGPEGHRRGVEARRGNEEGGDLHDAQPLLVGQSEAGAGELGPRGLARERLAHRAALLRRGAANGLQVVAEGPANAPRSVHGRPPREGPGPGDLPAPERGQPPLLDRAEHQGEGTRTPGPEVRRLAREEVWVA